MKHDASEKLLELINLVPPKLRRINESEASRKPAPEKWSKKEILGHLIDSAGNNHQRFVRVQLAEELRFPAYAQNDWVRCQGYGQESWPSLIELWLALNRHLAHIINLIPDEKRSMPCWIGENKVVTLAELMDGYIKHLEHHLKQMDSGFTNFREED